MWTGKRDLTKSVLASKYIFRGAVAGPSFKPDNRFPKLPLPIPPFYDARKGM
jgi:hypothetical protein